MKNPQVMAVFDSYPKAIRESLLALRSLILSGGSRIDAIGTVEETVKWGQPSYATIAGSPIRLGWNGTDPQAYALYFHCQTKLVSTFRLLYPETFSFEGNRAIVFRTDEQIPERELKRCIELALTYHRRKNKPLLGAQSSNPSHDAIPFSQ